MNDQIFDIIDTLLLFVTWYITWVYTGSIELHIIYRIALMVLVYFFKGFFLLFFAYKFKSDIVKYIYSFFGKIETNVVQKVQQAPVS